MRKLIILALSIAIFAGCSAPLKLGQRIDDRFGICMRLSTNATYRLLDRRVDYNVGRLMIEKVPVEVYIGFSPQFPGRYWSSDQRRTNGFIYVGKTRQDGFEKILLGNKRYANRGPLFVMFKAKSLRAIEPALVGGDFLHDCGKSEWW